MDPPRIHIFHYHKLNMSTNLLHPQLHTDGSNQVTRKFQIRVTPVNFLWGRPTVAWGWTDLGHQGSMSVFTRNKCYLILVLPWITFYPCTSSEPNFNPTNIFGILVSKGPFWMSYVKKDTFRLNHLARKISTGIIQKVHLFLMMFTQDSNFQIIIKSTC